MSELRRAYEISPNYAFLDGFEQPFLEPPRGYLYELTHRTGHTSRLDRPEIAGPIRFGHFSKEISDFLMPAQEPGETDRRDGQQHIENGSPAAYRYQR